MDARDLSIYILKGCLTGSEARCVHIDLGIILCMSPANERRRYIVTSPLIGWAHT